VTDETSRPALDLGAPLPAGDIDDPYPLLAKAREEGAVLTRSPFGPASDGAGAVHVVRYDEALAVLRDHETFSSRLLSDLMGPMFAGTMIAMDEPQHRINRALVAPAFRPKLLAHWQASVIRQVVDELIGEFAPRGHADLVQELTFAFPVRVIAQILGFPERGITRFQGWADDLISIFADWDRGVAALGEFRDYFLALVADRRAEPRDDLVSALVISAVEGQALDDEEVFSFVRLLLPAGIETTYRSLGNLLVGLLTHPAQLEAAKANRELRSAAIEEGLRWETPFLLVVRQCTRDTSLSGVEISKGQVVCVYVASANHDERRHKSPDAFDIGRDPTPHLAFGSGPHICLGMHLSRLETRIALDAILDRLPSIRLDPAAPQPRICGNLAFRSPDALHVRFD
jgi:cytochrome P450